MINLNELPRLNSRGIFRRLPSESTYLNASSTDLHPWSSRFKYKLTDLTGKTAIVTGGAVGIGKGIAYRLAEAGAKVMIVDLADQKREETVSEFKKNGWRISSYKSDV